MAKKRRQKKIRAQKHAQQQRYRPGQRLQEAVAVLRSGETDRALALATGALAAANDPVTSTAARHVVIEAHFRMAAATADLSKRLHHLDAALQLAPEEARLQYHRAMTLWCLGRVAEAVPHLEALVAQNGHRYGVAFLHQLACAATGQPWSDRELSEAEAHTVRLLQAVLHGKNLSELLVQTQDVPLLGNQPELWQTLLHMTATPQAAPLARLQAIAHGLAPISGSTVLQYYLGVVAMRQGDVKTAQSAWQSAAAAGMATPWLVENRICLLSEQAHELGQAGHWQELVDVLQSSQPTETLDPVLTEMLAVAHGHLGYAAAQADDWESAACHWREAVARNASRQIFQNLALAEEALGRWPAAADAWREMVRRRPRKQGHPDSLTDAQVAAIWHHIAECYERAEDFDEVITCLKNAVKYAPDDLELRLKMVDISVRLEREAAAASELDRILEINPQYVPALVRLGSLYDNHWDRDAMPIWRRVLSVEPHHEEARDALAQLYIKKVQEQGPRYGWFDRLRRRSEKEKIALLQEGLEELPGHPTLLLELGEQYAVIGKNTEACSYFEQAWEAAPRKASVVSSAMHRLLHANGGTTVTRLLPKAREMPGLLATFWVEQGRSALHCDLGQQWVNLFWAEALAVAEQGRHGDTKAYVLVSIFEAAGSEQATDLAARYAARIRAEHPHSGGVEYIDAFHAAHDRHDQARAIRLLRQAQRTARQANETGIAELAERVEQVLKSPLPLLFDLLNAAGGRRGRNPLLDVLDEMDEEDVDEFRRHF
jgi:tetratricopeptide (TPR) repeat protein